jgi:hypothetical protein
VLLSSSVEGGLARAQDMGAWSIGAACHLATAPAVQTDDAGVPFREYATPATSVAILEAISSRRAGMRDGYLSRSRSPLE